MTGYVGVFVPVTTGGWRALLPDLPNYQVEEGSLDLAILRAGEFLEKVISLGTAATDVGGHTARHRMGLRKADRLVAFDRRHDSNWR
jgi:hypothetical protein